MISLSSASVLLTRVLERAAGEEESPMYLPNRQLHDTARFIGKGYFCEVHDEAFTGFDYCNHDFGLF